MLSEISQTDARQRQNSKKKFKKLAVVVHVLSNMQNVAISVQFCKERQRNEHSIIKHAYTAIVLVAVAVEVCLLNSLKPNKRQNNNQPNERKTNESPAEQKGGCQCRKHLSMKRLSKIITCKMTFPPFCPG